MRWLFVAVLLAGCALPGAPNQPTYATVDPPPDGGGPAECHSTSAQTMAVPLRARAVEDAGGRGPGVHRLDAKSFLWVWASYEDTLREDRVSRIQGVEAHREPDPGAPVSLCATVDIVAPIQVDREPRSYDVAVLVEAPEGVPDGDLRVVVNWVAGCPCATLPSGNATALFPKDAPESG